MKIAFIITKSEVGGAQSWVKDQIDYLEEHAECHLITSTKGWLTSRSSFSGCLLDKRLLKRHSAGFVIALTRYIKEHNIELIVASSANAGIYARAAKLLTRIKCIYVSHGWSSVYNGGRFSFLYTAIEKWLSYSTDKVLCVSNSDWNIAHHDIGIKREKLALIRNGINPNNVIPHSKRKKKNTAFKILFVGRLAHPKRPELLANAISQLDNVELHIVGDGPLKDKIDCHSNNNVFLHGEIKDFNDFTSYDAFSLISDSEGLPVSALEAAAAKLPLLLSDVGGCPELIMNNGLLTTNTVYNIKASIQSLIEHYQEYSESAHSVANQFISQQNSYIELYNSTINSAAYRAIRSGVVR